MNRMSFVAVVLGLLISLIDPTGAYGATAILDSSPPDGSQLDAVPEVVEIWSTEPLDPALTQVIVVAPNGARIDTGILQIDPDDATHLTASIMPFGPDGHYVVHLLSGEPNTARERSDSVAFDVGNAAGCERGNEAGACAAALPEIRPGQAAPLPDGGSVTVEISGERAGPVDISVALIGPSGETYDEARVWVRAAHVEMDHGEFPHQAVLNETGIWTANYVGMGMAGRWRVAVDVITAPGAVPVTIAVPIEMKLPG